MKIIRAAAVVVIAAIFPGLVSCLYAQSDLPAKPQAPAIEVAMIQAGDVLLPAEFQVALYEDLIRELQKQGDFRQVYRDGDRAASGTPELVTLYTTVKSFKKGSELERDVTTVGGATSITVHCQFKRNDGTVLLERDIEGKVRLIGDNLKATDDFAKKAAKLGSESLAANSTSSKASGSKSAI